MLVIWLVKNKPEKEEPANKGAAVSHRYPTTAANEPSLQPAPVQYAELDVEAVRKAYRALEQEADAAGLGRKEYETVREWMDRMSWTVSESFFKTYDLVRYGSETLTASEGEPFLKEIKKIKEKIFKRICLNACWGGHSIFEHSNILISPFCGRSEQRIGFFFGFFKGMESRLLNFSGIS
ncbi:DUF4129 domain-containing protein [Planococcus glaciei]|nr:DUF4129 domain-containing protein [Planococcus glaciei]QDY44613.1 DUF4129 domain-containing protein [Planococcus glaciei]